MEDMTEKELITVLIEIYSASNVQTMGWKIRSWSIRSK